MSIDALEPGSTTGPRRDAAPAAEVHLLGRVDLTECLALQQRLVYEATSGPQPRVVLLLCEHPDEITVGRQGSWAHIRLDRHELASRDVAVRWVGRGGGCVWHTAGQLAIYPIVPLEALGLSVGQYLDRFQSGVLAALAEFNVIGQTRPGRHGIWGRGGQLAAFGVAVRYGVTSHGGWINVSASDRLFRLLDTDPWDHTPMTSLVAERRQPARMTSVREALARQVTAALGCSRYHLHTGHPILRQNRQPRQGPSARAG
jgi:lipoyl(octanoyl) transferase